MKHFKEMIMNFDNGNTTETDLQPRGIKRV